jgi:hypothetical protein
MNNIEKAIKFLDIKKPYKIVLVSHAHKEIDACYWEMRSPTQNRLSHLIKVWVGNNSRSIEASIIHELIHAWQSETGLTEYHGPWFIKMAKALEYRTGLRDIYIPGQDKKRMK